MDADLAKLTPPFILIPQYDAEQTASTCDFLSATAAAEGDPVEQDLEVLTDASKLLICVLSYILEQGDQSAYVKGTERRIQVVSGKLLGIRDRYKVSVSGLKVTGERVQQLEEEIRTLKKKIGDTAKTGPAPKVMNWDPASCRWTSTGSDNMSEQALDLSLGKSMATRPLAQTFKDRQIVMGAEAANEAWSRGSTQSTPMSSSFNPNRNLIDKVVAAAKRKQIMEVDGGSDSESDSVLSSDEETEPCEDQVELDRNTSQESQSETDIDIETGDSSEGEDVEQPETSYICSIPLSSLVSTSKLSTTHRSAGTTLPRVTLTLGDKLPGDPVKPGGSVVQKKYSSANRLDERNTPARKVESTSRQNSSPGSTCTPQQKPFHCNICHKGFNQKHGLKGHMELHNPNRQRSLKCPSCPKTFFNSNLLRQHMVSHKARQVPCTICNMTFKTNYALKHHMPVHSEDRPFRCDHCDMAFKRRPDWKDHQMVHVDERPFACQICELTFKWGAALRNHLLTHEGVKRHKCKGCDSAFLAKGNLKRHMLTCPHSNSHARL